MANPCRDASEGALNVCHFVHLLGGKALVRDSSVQRLSIGELLRAGVPEHPRVVSIQGWFFAGPKNSLKRSFFPDDCEGKDLSIWCFPLEPFLKSIRAISVVGLTMNSSA